MLNKVREYIQQNRLLEQGKRYLVALSGGADSVCLLLVLKQLGYQVEAVHCNFLLRGDESHRDETFARQLCEEQGVPFHAIHFDTRTYASLHKISIEMAARELRYQFFEQLRQDIQAEAICVAHHQDDSVETILLNLLRGTGIHGLSGIKPRNGHILRPLLCVSRDDIEKWLEAQQQNYVTDSTNMQDDVMRNKLRLNILPLLSSTFPSAKERILKTAKNIGEATTIYDHYTQEALSRLVDKNTLSIDALLQEPSSESILFEWLSTFHFSPTSIESIYESMKSPISGREWCSATHQATICRSHLIVEPIQAPPPILRIPEKGVYLYDETAKICLIEQSGVCIVKSKDTACLDAEHIHFPLTLRPISAGDRFIPFGMRGSKLVSDYLTDLHLSIFEKRRTLVLCDSDGNILWLVGHRPDAHFSVTSATCSTLIVNFS